MVHIIFESHATSEDNEKGLASGFNDVALSSAGVEQAKELGDRYPIGSFDTIFCSDLQRSYKTAELAFGDKYPIIRDPRLRECDYGDLTQHPKSEVDTEKSHRIDVPFPNGESYTDTCERMRQFLIDLTKNYQDKTILIIGHRATQYGLEHWIKDVTIQEAVTAPWSWQPGWEYDLNFVTES